jgi:hypothetical protein
MEKTIFTGSSSLYARHDALRADLPFKSDILSSRFAEYVETTRWEMAFLTYLAF